MLSFSHPYFDPRIQILNLEENPLKLKSGSLHFSSPRGLQPSSSSISVAVTSSVAKITSTTRAWPAASSRSRTNGCFSPTRQPSCPRPPVAPKRASACPEPPSSLPPPMRKLTVWRPARRSARRWKKSRARWRLYRKIAHWILAAV